MNYKEIITANLDQLLTSTVVSGELAIAALQKGIVTQGEFQQLNAPEGTGSTNYSKATLLYTRIAPKWTNSQFGVFLSVLQQSGNGKAVEILRSSRGSHNDLIEKIYQSNGAGSFEGYLLEDELHAKQIVTDLKSTNFNLKDAIASGKPETLERLSQFISSGKVWWNDSRPQLPPDYIERRVFSKASMTKTKTTLLDLVLPSNDDDPDWNKWDDHVLVLLVDSPGMGKSCALTRLEQELREKLDKSPRVIVRINLNSVGSEVGESAVEDEVKEVIRELFQPLKNCKIGEEECPVYVLLDGLDEVLPHNQESVLGVLRFFLSDNALQKGWVIEKVVLTTRPHLKEKIESEFNVRAYSLVPLTTQEQLEFIRKRTGTTDAVEYLIRLPRTMGDLLSNPLMLSMICNVVIPGEQSTSFDQYEIYMKFMAKKHELYVSEKEGRSYVPNRVVKRMLNSSVPFYNYVAIQEILGEDELSIVVDLAEKSGKTEIMQKVLLQEKQSELLSFGVVVKADNMLKFSHRSFAEFFYTKLMTDIKNTPRDIRNALFALQCKRRNNVAQLVSCVVGKDGDAVQFVSKGWIYFIPEGEILGGYSCEFEGILFDHVMSNTIKYESSCPRKDELVVRDIQEDSDFFKWLCKRAIQNSDWIQNFLLNENNTRILAALVFSAHLTSQFGGDTRKEAYQLRELSSNLLIERIASMPVKELEVIAQDILRDIRDAHKILHLHSVFTLLASIFSKEKLHYLIVNERTRVTDVTGGLNIVVGTCLGEEFLPKKLLKFRFKYGVKRGNSLFQHEFPKYLMDRVWEEIGDNIQDAVQVVQDDGDFEFIRQMEHDLRSYKGFSKLKESRRMLLIDVLANVDWSNFNFNIQLMDSDNYFIMIAYGKLELGKWKKFTENRQLSVNSTNELQFFLCCLMLSALEEERVTVNKCVAPSVLVHAQSDLIRKLAIRADGSFGNMSSFIMDLSRKKLTDLAKMKREDPVLLSDFPSIWEVFFHADKGLAKMDRDKVMVVLNVKYVLERIVEGLLNSSDDASLSQEVELRRVFLSEESLVPEQIVKRATDFTNVLTNVANRTRELWLKDVDEGKSYIMGVVQLYLDILHDSLGYWMDYLVKMVPFQLLVVAEENVRLGRGLQWANFLARVKAFMRGHFRQTLSLYNTWAYRWNCGQYNRESDWYVFLKVVLTELPEIRNKIPADYATRTKIYTTPSCSLLRVWIQLFGEEETRRQADESLRMWERALIEMKDGELLHIAVEVGSLIGVRWTAWPRSLKWRNENNKTALEYAEEKLGKGHEVTKYLARVMGNLTRSGFFGK